MIKRVVDDPRFRIIADFTEIISVIILVPAGIRYLFLIFKGSPKLLILLGVVFLIALYFIWSRIKNTWAELTNKIQEEKINHEIKSIQSQKTNKVEKFIPSDKQLKNWFKVAFRKAKQWSEDSEFTGVHFNIYWSPSYKSIGMPSFTFYSAWKQEKINIYFGEREVSEGFEEVQMSLKGELKPSPGYKVDFLGGFKKWHQAFMQSYKKLRDKIGDSFTIGISLGSREIHFLYMYTVGKINVSDFFIFNGVTLRHTRDNSEIEI